MIDDDSGGILAAQLTFLIEATGATDLFETGNNYFLYPEGTSPVQLKSSGAAVIDGQLGAWQPIAAEQVGAGYQVAWKLARQRLDLERRQRRQLRLQRRLRSRRPVGAAVGRDQLRAGPERRSRCRTSHNGDRDVRSDTPVRCGGRLFHVSRERCAGSSQSRRRDAGGRSAWRLAADCGRAGRSRLPGGLEACGQHLDLERRQWRQHLSNIATSQRQPMGDPVGGDHLPAGSQRRSRCRTSDNGDRGLRSDTPVRYGGRLFHVSREWFAGSSQGRRRDGGGRSAWRLAGDRSRAGRSRLPGGLEGGGCNLCTIWNVDSGGNYLSNIANLNGSHWAIQSAETTFRQDLNGDGSIGIPPDDFDIDFEYSGDSAYRSYFEAAAARWEQVIIGDLPRRPRSRATVLSTTS